MRVNEITAFSRTRTVNHSTRTQHARGIVSEPAAPPQNIRYISFRGNSEKDPRSIALLAPENNYFGNPYRKGGLGDVADAFPEAISKDAAKVTGTEGLTLDARSFFPYYSPKDTEGKLVIMNAEGVKKFKELEEARGSEFRYKSKLFTEKKNDAGKTVPDQYFFEYKKYFQEVSPDYKLKDGEKFVSIQKIDKGYVPNYGKDGFFFLEDTGISGTVGRCKDDVLEWGETPYRVFEVDMRPELDKNHPERMRKDRMFLVHTKEVSSSGEAYGYFSAANNMTKKYLADETKIEIASDSSYGLNPSEAGGKMEKLYTGIHPGEAMSGEQARAVEDALEKMAQLPKENKYHFNPQNIVMHDRFYNQMFIDGVKKAADGNDYWKGIRYDGIFHNTGRGYQGAMANPLDFFKATCTKKDFEELKNDKNFNKIVEIHDKIKSGNATANECQQLDKFFEPKLGRFKDEFGTYNITKVMLEYGMEYPNNISMGTVSKTYGRESRDPRTSEVASGISKTLKELFDKGVIIDVVNGENPASLSPFTVGGIGSWGEGELEKVLRGTENEIFTKADTALAQEFPVHEYVPFSPELTKKVGDKTEVVKMTPEEMFEAKRINKETFLNTVAAAKKKGIDLAKVIAPGRANNAKNKLPQNLQDKYEPILGYLSKYEKGDILMATWGRPDSQKGYPVALRALKKLLSDETIPYETRKHIKMIVGSGPDAWIPISDESAKGVENNEWYKIKKELKEIANISAVDKNGKTIEHAFAGNTMYVNCFFPNKIASMCDFFVGASRFEPCGITPLESYTAGTPIINVNSGGAPDFTDKGKTGFLTKDPFMLNANELKVNPKAENPMYELDEARINNVSDQFKEIFDKVAKEVEVDLSDADKKEGGFKARQTQWIENCFNEKVGWSENGKYNGGDPIRDSALGIYLRDKLKINTNDVPKEVKNTLYGDKPFDDTAFDKKTPTKEPKSGNKILAWWKNLPTGGKAGIIGGVVALGAVAAYGIYSHNKTKQTELNPKDIYNEDLEPDEEEVDISAEEPATEDDVYDYMVE